MKRINIIYWIATILLGALMLFSGITNAFVTKESVDLISRHLGFPVYMIAFLGWAKVLGVIGLFLPGYPRLKEWVYAGFTFDITGALYASIAVGDPASGWVFLLIGYVIIGVSYIFYHKRLKHML